MQMAVAQPRSRAEIVSIVRYIKKQICFDGFKFPVVEFIEKILPQIDKDFKYEYCEKSELPLNVYAYYSPVENLMKIREDVYLRAIDGSSRDLFTLAHEVGHYFLHDEIILTRKSESEIPAYENPEWQANAFAGELLIPTDKILGMSTTEIMNNCNVSRQAAEISSKYAKKSNYYTH